MCTSVFPSETPVCFDIKFLCDPLVKRVIERYVAQNKKSKNEQ